AQLHLLHVVPEKHGPRELPADLKDRMQAARLELGKLPAEIPPHGMVIARVVREGNPGDEILRYARETGIDLVAMGTHGRSGLAHILMGSIAEKVIRGAACPVIVIRPFGIEGEEAAPDEAVSSLGQVPESNRALELLQRAVAVRATDIHIDPVSAQEYSVRFRVDGRIEPYCTLDRSIAGPLLMQLKLMSRLEIAQPFEPQEARVHLPESMLDVEVRITTVPACGGEAVSLRLLKNEETPASLGVLGLSPGGLASVAQMIQQGEGLVLVTGPTGSGKTTTVHAMLRLLDNGARNIVSIEDPVEYRVPAIRQVSVDARHGLTMTRGLRTVLRMDPDVVFIGEVRDVEALEIAMRAASSGRYVFSTLHTRDVASTVTALRDLHADDLSLAGNLRGIVCQRLIRKLCLECCSHSAATAEERAAFAAEGIEPTEELSRPEGCEACRGTGYLGRIGVFETLVVSGKVADAIQTGSSEDDLRRLIRSEGTVSLTAEALKLARDGVTSFDEARSIKWA
ncbi:MAG: Flp pilus assembly complex ATPase component TadA, partial [Planctomycetia bacterium]|nr:Flp pilus assembly complex ATPase component TadA [Planctomycetia bacterium]